MREKKFPIYVLEDNGYDFSFHVEDHPLLILIGLDQRHDLYQGYLFMQNHLLNRPLIDFSAQEFEQLIKDLHKIIAGHLIPATTSQFLSGEYALTRPVIEKNFPIEGHCLKSIRESFSLSEEEAGMVDMVCGEGSGQEYRKFLKLISEKIKDSYAPKTAEDFYLSSKLSLVDWVEREGLEDHLGYKIHLKFYKECAEPQLMSGLMQGFCWEMTRMIQSGEDPVKIAAKALLLADIHPFQNGNGRLARLLMNSILVSYDLTPLALAKNKLVFYQNFESCGGDLQKTCELIESEIHKMLRDNRQGNVQFLDENVLIGQSEHGLAGIFRKSGCDVFKEEEGALYQMTLPMVRDEFEYRPDLPGSEEKQKIMVRDIEHNFETQFLTARINANWCFERGEFYKNQGQLNVAGYCYYRAAEFWIKESQPDLALKVLLKVVALYSKHSFCDGAYDLCHEAMMLAKNLGDNSAVSGLEACLEGLSFVKDYRLKLNNSENQDPALEKENVNERIDQIVREGKQAYKNKEYSNAIQLFEKSNRLLKTYSEKYLEDVAQMISQNHFAMACCYKGTAAKEQRNIFRSDDSYLSQCHKQAIDHFVASHEIFPNQKVEVELNKYRQTTYAAYVEQAGNLNEENQFAEYSNFKPFS